LRRILKDAETKHGHLNAVVQCEAGTSARHLMFSTNGLRGTANAPNTSRRERGFPPASHQCSAGRLLLAARRFVSPRRHSSLILVARYPNEEHVMSEKKVWFITGAGRGLGVDIAKAALA